MKYFLKKKWAMKYLDLWCPGYKKHYEKFVKPSSLPPPSSYILNVRSLSLSHLLSLLLKVSRELEGKLSDRSQNNFHKQLLE